LPIPQFSCNNTGNSSARLLEDLQGNVQNSGRGLLIRSSHLFSVVFRRRVKQVSPACVCSKISSIKIARLGLLISFYKQNPVSAAVIICTAFSFKKN